MGITIIFPDENLFIAFLDNQIDISYLDKIEKQIGKICLGPEMYDKILKDIIKKRIKSVFIRDIWKKNLCKYNEYYFKIIENISKNHSLFNDQIKKDIEELEKMLYRVIKSFNNGFSKYDAKIMAYAFFIKKYSNYEPIIVSDDGDILVHANIISSYFGKTFIFLSIFELLRILNCKEIILKYIKNKDIDDLQLLNMEQIPKRSKYQTDLIKLCNKTLLSSHPYLYDETIFKKIIKC
ncbi:MAG: hypothetical protein ACTSPW_14115 [Promethearchaeota archaeon]